MSTPAGHLGVGVGNENSLWDQRIEPLFCGDLFQTRDQFHALAALRRAATVTVAGARDTG